VVDNLHAVLMQVTKYSIVEMMGSIIKRANIPGVVIHRLVSLSFGKNQEAL
jgi:hypothetical protein